jgi:hypothetical protein
MTQHPGGSTGPRPRRAARPAVWLWPAGCLLVGVGAGAAWRLLVPVLVNQQDEERAVGGDSVLALVCLVAGLLVGAALARAGAADWRRYLVVLAGSTVGAYLAWGTVRQLGAPSLGATGVPLLWPVATSATAFISILVSGLTRSASPGDPGGPPVGEPQQVLGSQLHVQAAAPGAHQDGLVREGPGVQHGGQRFPLAERADPADDVPG